jgi:hypothetical protein
MGLQPTAITDNAMFVLPNIGGGKQATARAIK